MFKYILNTIKNIDKLTLKIIKYGFSFSLLVCIVSSIILLIYDVLYKAPDLYYVGLSLFKLGLMLYIEFIICGFAMDSIKKQLN